MLKSTKSRIQNLQSKIIKAQAEIEQIRATCNHQSFFIGMYSWRPGSMNPARICNDCDGQVVGITAEESSNCWDKYKAAVPTSETLVLN